MTVQLFVNIFVDNRPWLTYYVDQVYTKSLKMRDNVISFRFTDDEVKALQALQVPEDKSPSQTAARLLRELLAGTINKSTLSTSSTFLDNIEQLVDKRLEAALTEVRSQLEELRGKSLAR